MARATAKCTCAKCGATFEVSTIRANRKAADSWEEWAVGYYDTCTACEQAERQETAAKYAQRAQEDGLPALRGTERQVSWAETIRHEKIVAANDLIAECMEKGDNKGVEALELTLNYVLAHEATARWWIDHRTDDSIGLLKGSYRAALDAKAVELDSAAHASEESNEPEQPKKDTVLVPENAKYGTANVCLDDACVQVYYPKDDTFRAIVKANGFTWNSAEVCWEKKITQYTGNVKDRAADIASQLLTAGFSVSCADDDVRHMAVSGEFEPECRRWVRLRQDGNYAGWLSIEIPGRQDDSRESVYEAARKITGSRYSKGCVMAPVANHALVEDFAGLYGYKLSDGAKQAIAEHEESVKVSPAPARRADAPNGRDALGAILQSDDAILPDLVDE